MVCTAEGVRGHRSWLIIGCSQGGLDGARVIPGAIHAAPLRRNLGSSGKKGFVSTADWPVSDDSKVDPRRSLMRN
jgi:hypothetical protein